MLCPALRIQCGLRVYVSTEDYWKLLRSPGVFFHKKLKRALSSYMSVSLDFQVLGKLFCMFEVFSVRSALIHSTKIFEKDVGVETFALKFINNCVALRFSFCLRVEWSLASFFSPVTPAVEKINAFLLSTCGSLSASQAEPCSVFRYLSLHQNLLSHIFVGLLG